MWKPVTGFEGRYEVSDLGRVRSLPYTLAIGKGKVVPGRVLKISGRRYPQVGIGKDNPVRVHKLVADAFLGPRPEGKEVLHGDDDKYNCALSNLRYGTRTENWADFKRNGRVKQRRAA